MFLKVDNVGAERMSSGRLFLATGQATQNAKMLRALADICRIVSRTSVQRAVLWHNMYVGNFEQPTSPACTENLWHASLKVS